MKIGFLPFYIKLYDEIGINRTVLENVYDEMATCFEDKGVKVVTTEFCRIKPEFEKAVETFEREDVDAIVTWHAAYSPSLEAIEALVRTKLPIIVLDSTPTAEFTAQSDTVEIDWNHGIHGVMDLCSMLKRYGKPYAIAAGHYLESDCIDKVCGFVRSAVAAKKLNGMKVGLVGGEFEGMGDFAVEHSELKERFGISVEEISSDCIVKIKELVTTSEIQKEKNEDKQYFEFDDNIIDDEYNEYISSCLAVRKCIDQYGYDAFSINFLNVDGLGTMPFTECCKSMERGIGYAGEGDVLTAAFTGALISGYPETSFVEIFCPNWRGNEVFLSHMGEMNYRIAEGKPLMCRTGSKFIKGTMPYAGYAKMKAGKGVYVNISREKEDYQMLVASCEMLSAETDNMKKVMRGWMKPQTNTIAEFLEKISKNGATHHSIFVYGATVEEMEYFAQLLSLKVKII